MKRILFLTTALFAPAALAGSQYVVGPNPTILPAWATTAVGIGQLTPIGVIMDMKLFNASLTGCTASPVDDAAAVNAAVARVNADWAAGQIDYITWAGCLYSSVGFVFNQGVPAHIVGYGSDYTKFIEATVAKAGTNFSGDMVAVSGAFGGNSIVPTNSTIPNLATYNAGTTVVDITWVGSTTFNSNGIMLYDFIDHAQVKRNVIDFVNGCGICAGLYKNTTAGVIRESQVENNRLEIVGSNSTTLPATGTSPAAIGIYSTCNGTAVCNTGSASNAMHIDHNRVYAYAADGIVGACNFSLNQGEHKNWISDNQIEGRPDGTSAGAGIRLGNPLCTGLAPYDFNIDDNISDVPTNQALLIDGPSSYATLAQAPYNINVHNLTVEKGGIGSGQTGIQVNYCGRACTFETGFVNVAGTNFSCGASVAGTLQLETGPDSNNWTNSILCTLTKLDTTVLSTGSFGNGDMLVANQASTGPGPLIVKDGGAAAGATTGSWTPTVTPATPGNWAATYTTQSGTYYSVGNMMCVDINLVFTGNQTTAAGALQISLPASVPSGDLAGFEISNWSGSIAGATNGVMLPQAGHAWAFVGFWKSALNFPSVYLTASNFITATATTLTAGGCYF